MSPEVWAHRLVLALLAFHVDARAEVLAEIDARGDWREVAEQAAGLAAIAVWDMHSTGRACDTAAAADWMRKRLDNLLAEFEAQDEGWI